MRDQRLGKTGAGREVQVAVEMEMAEFLVSYVEVDSVDPTRLVKRAVSGRDDFRPSRDFISDGLQGSRESRGRNDRTLMAPACWSRLSMNERMTSALKLLSSLLYPRLPRSLFGMDPFMKSFHPEALSPEFDLKLIRKAVSALVEHLRAKAAFQAAASSAKSVG